MGSFSCGCFCSLFIVMPGIATAILFFILFLTAAPSDIRMHVENATLSHFNLTDDDTLHYNLSLEVSARNPGKKDSIYYKKVEAKAFFDSKWLDTVYLPNFIQGQKNTTMIFIAFNGHRLLELDSKNVDEFNRQRIDGSFKIQVKIYLSMNHRSKMLITFKSSDNPDGTCDLRLPLGGVATDPRKRFTRTKCPMDYHRPPSNF